MKISEQINKIISNCESGYIEVKRGKSKPLKYNQREIINRIDCYLNDQYIDRDTDDLFWNIITPRIPHFAKLISPDTKDFYPYGLGEHNFLQAWALKKNVKKWFDDNAFYQILNDSSEGLTNYGSEVWKRGKNENGKTIMEEVDIKNLYFDQSVKWMNDTDIVEKHYLSRRELWDKRDVWDNVDALLKLEQDEFEFNEFWGFNDEEGEYEYQHVIIFADKDKEVKVWGEKTTKDKSPYYDFHLGKYRGRWMRVGVPERLFKVQARANELVNQNAQATAISSLLILGSNNADITGNVLEEAVNGQIIGDDTLKQIAIQNVGLAQFIQEMNMINQQADKLCLTPEIVQGEASPSNTTFRGIAVVNAGAVSAFKNYRQNFFEKIAFILLKDIFPGLVKDWNRDNLIEMSEDDEDVDAYDKAVVEYQKREMMLNGTLITPELEQALVANVQDNIKATGRRIKLADNFFNFKWGFKMMPTDESVDKTATNDAYNNALQMTINSQGSINDIPLFKQYLENNGISPQKMTPKQKQELQQTPPQGNIQDLKTPDKLLAAAQPIQ